MSKRSRPARESMSAARRRTRAKWFSARGRFREAVDCLREALRQPAELSVERLSLWNELGMACKYTGNFAAAERYYRLALKNAARCCDGKQLNFFRANIYHNLGGLEHSRRHFRQGERYTRKAWQLRRAATGAKSLGAASDMAALAALLDGQKRFAESEALYRRALRVYSREYGKSHPEIAVVLNNLAALFQSTGRPSQAERYYRAALAMKRKELGPFHPDLAVTLNNLGIFRQDQGKTQEALRCFEKALTIFRRSLGPSHPYTRAALRNLRRWSAA